MPIIELGDALPRDELRTTQKTPDVEPGVPDVSALGYPLQIALAKLNMEDLKDLRSGEAQVLSYFKPGIFPDEYLVDIRQPVTGPSSKDSIPLHTTKTIFVNGLDPYQLPAGSLHSFYPGEGEAVESRILPHVVLSDPHIPWELSPDNGQISNEFLNGAPIPWLALLVFTADELKTLPPTSLPLAPSPTLAVQMSKKQLQVLRISSQDVKVQVPLSDDELNKSQDDTVNIIFVNSTAFRANFAAQVMNKPEKEPAIARYSYLAHVRRSRSTQAQNASTDSFGMIVGHRTGPLATDTLITAYAHLVSLKGVWDRLSYPEAGSSDLTALVSLHSWSFSWVPDTEAEIREVIENLSRNVRPLARELKDNSGLPDQPSEDMKWIKRRMESGYTFVRHRLTSGETSAALLRGPLLPHRPRGDEMLNTNPTNHGSGLQIIDARTGFVDISYSVAWNLGRSLAIENTGFTTALSALRAHMLSVFKKGTPPKRAGNGLLDPVPQDLPAWVGNLQRAAEEAEFKQPITLLASSGVGSRWRTLRDKYDSSRPQIEIPKVDVHSGLSAVQEMLRDEINIILDDKIWYAREPSEPTREGMFLPKVVDFIYNELLSLRTVPQNYLFPEPDILGTEAILTFYLDPLWLDALIDGALSVGNHSAINDDVSKDEIKRALNEYLAVAEADPWRARIPTWGTVVCGKLVRSFPDPRIRTGGDGTSPSPELLATKKLQDDALLLLFNCRPDDLPHGLTISQPPHQQRFAAATVLTPSLIQIDFPGVPLEDAEDDVKDLKIAAISDGTNSLAFDFETRCLRPSNVMSYYVRVAKEVSNGRGGTFPATGSSALMSLAMGDKLLELTVKPTSEQADAGRASPLQPFQLHVADTGSSDLTRLGSRLTPDGMSNPFAAPPALELSSGSMPLVYRAATIGSPPTSTPVSQRLLSVLDVAQLRSAVPPGPPSPLETSCRVLNRYETKPNTSIASLLVSIKAKDGALKADSPILLHRMRVAFPLATLLAPDSTTQPTVKLLRRGASGWSAGSGNVASWPPRSEGQLGGGEDAAGSSGPALIVELTAWAATSAREVDMAFLLSDVLLSSGISRDVFLDVVEEYAVIGESKDVERRAIAKTCRVEGLEMACG